MEWLKRKTDKYRWCFYLIVVVLMTGCTGCGDTKDAAADGSYPANGQNVLHAGFDQTMHVADSLYNSMQFRDAYDLYLQLLDDKEAKADSEKMLNVLNSLCMASELADHKMEQTKWMKQLIDLAKKTGNAYYESLGLEAMGKRIYSEGNRQQGIQYVQEALDLISKTDHEMADHLAHSYMLILNGLYAGMDDFENALKTDERNVRRGTPPRSWPPSITPRSRSRKSCSRRPTTPANRLSSSSYWWSYLAWLSIPSTSSDRSAS